MNEPIKKRAWGDQVLSQHEQRQLRERVLFETAARLFNRFGFRGTSMSMLTKELGLTKGALYHYVKDKSDLLYKLNIHAAKASREAHDRGVAEGKNGYERVHGIVRNYLLAALESPTETFVLLEDDALTPEQSSEIIALRKSLMGEMRKEIARGIEDGSITPCDPKLVSQTIVGSMAWMLKWYDPDREMSKDDVSRGMADLLSRMISSDPKPLA